MHHSSLGPQFVRAPRGSRRAPKAIAATLLGAALVLAALVWAVGEWFDYDTPTVACATSKPATDWWATRDDPRGQPDELILGRRDIEHQAAGAVQCTLRRGMSEPEIRRLFGPPDDEEAYRPAPDPATERQATPYVRRWSTEYERPVAVNVYDGFDVWFDGPDLRRVVEFRLVHLTQNQ